MNIPILDIPHFQTHPNANGTPAPDCTNMRWWKLLLDFCRISVRVAILEVDSWSIAYPFLWLIGNRTIITNKSLYALHAGVSKVFESLRSGSCLEDQWTELQANWCHLLPAAASFELSITFRSRCLPHVSYSAVKGLSHLRVATAMPAQHWPPSARLTFQLDVSGFSKDS